MQEESIRLVLAVVLSVILVPLLMIYQGWAVQWLWYWFVVPLGWPALTLPHAIGIAMVTSLLTHQYNVAREQSQVYFCVSVLLAPALTVAFGYFTQLFI